MKQPSVSIIIPVYNMERYLRRCLDSVVGQTLKEIEIICINDGSTDSSLAVLKEYEKNDPRVSVVDKENAGQGAARNIGINMAKGEYIGFVDGDDWIAPEMYERMFRAAKQNDSDLYLCGVKRIDYEGNDLGIRCDYDRLLGEKFGNVDVVFNRHDVIDEIFKLSRFCWNKIYKRLFLKKNIIFFSEISCYEDNIFHFRSFLEAERISIIREPLYCYVINRAGAASSKNRQIWDLFEAMREVKQYLSEKNAENTFFQRFDNYRIRRYLTYCYIVDKEDKKLFFDKIRDEFQEMEVNSNPFVKGPEKVFYMMVRKLPYGLFKFTHVPGYVCFYVYMKLWLRNQKPIATRGGRSRNRNIDIRDVV